MSGKIAMLSAISAGLLTAHGPPVSAATMSGTFFEDNLFVNCATADICEVLFPPLPSTLTGQFVTFTEVSCLVTTDVGLIAGQLAVTDNNTNVRRLHFFNVERSPGRVSFWNALDLKVTGGPPRQMRLTLQKGQTSGTTFAANCTLVGKISEQ